jgi:uncharacterized protein YndB with AHSA1/START domain
MTDPLTHPDADREIVATRLFPVDRDTLFRAFSDPDTLARWWGPEGFTNTIEEFDLRPGGAWRFVMRGPDGAEFPSLCEFLEVERPQRIVILHLEPMHRFLLDLTYEDEPPGARLTWLMRLETAEEAERTRSFLVQANEQNLDRLASVLPPRPLSQHPTPNP